MCEINRKPFETQETRGTDLNVSTRRWKHNNTLNWRPIKLVMLQIPSHLEEAKLITKFIPTIIIKERHMCLAEKQQIAEKGFVLVTDEVKDQQVWKGTGQCCIIHQFIITSEAF
ncbi:hypothetical protein ILYODFUR_008867 [Ilyodon furcidens]|uniref:Uncharacterized protein n=1 Tax=Ilyodon furcidens TaxID=33524 RepID=A0ABV0VFJ5_9TELE